MADIAIDLKDQVVMALTHFFITKADYEPVLVHGTKNEIWLQNLKAPYKIIRINSNYVHNNEQFEYDQLKIDSVVHQIKRKTFSLSMNTLNIYTNVADRVELLSDKKLENVVINSFDDLKTNDFIQDAFPQIENNLIKDNNGLELIFNVTNEINSKTLNNEKVFDEVFRKKKTYLTSILIIINIVMFLITLYLGNGAVYTDVLLRLGANNGILVKAGQLYRLLTYAFLHASIMHLLVNMYSLYIMGNQIENYLGKYKFIIIYIISAISGALMSIIFGSSISVGASGAIFGLMGAMLYFGLQYRLFLGEALKTQIIPVIILNLLFGFLMSGVDNGCHIGGLVAGYLAAMALGIDGKKDDDDRRNGLIVLCLYIGILSAVVFILK